MSFMIFGAGLSARTFAKQHAKDFNTKIYGTTRSQSRFSLLEQANITPILFPDKNDDTKLLAAIKDTTHLIISIAPDDEGDILLRNKTLFNKMPNLQWICYLSTVGVYGDLQGAWIDETAACRPKVKRNQARILAEQEWVAYANSRIIPICILRLAGIYGNGRNAFIKLQQGTAHRVIKHGQIFNRIHTEDIAGVIAHFAKNKQEGYFNLADGMPCPPQDVVTYAAKLMGIEPPAEIAFEDAALSPMARSFYQDSKRILNKKLIDTGYKLKYKNYQTALNAMWARGDWQQG